MSMLSNLLRRKADKIEKAAAKVTLTSGDVVPRQAYECTMATLRRWEQHGDAGAEVLAIVQGMASVADGTKVEEISEAHLDAIGAGGCCSGRGVLAPLAAVVIRAALRVEDGVVAIVEPVAG